PQPIRDGPGTSHIYRGIAHPGAINGCNNACVLCWRVSCAQDERRCTRVIAGSRAIFLPNRTVAMEHPRIRQYICRHRSLICAAIMVWAMKGLIADEIEFRPTMMAGYVRGDKKIVASVIKEVNTPRFRLDVANK